VGDEEAYVFKHALVQDAAYGSLLRSTRQQLHQRIAAALERIAPQTADTAPEILAHHHSEAGAVETAIAHWQRAGARATERSADVEAIAHLERARALLMTLAQSPERDARELQLQIALTSRFIAVKGYTSPEVVRANRRALELQERLGDGVDAFPALYGRWVSLYTMGRAAESLAWAEATLQRAERQAEALPRLVGHRLVGTSSLVVGKPRSAVEHLTRAAGLGGDGIDDQAGYSYGQDIGAAIAAYHALALWYLGFPDQAFRRAEAALARARQIKHANTTGYVLYHSAWLYNMAACLDEVERFGRELTAISERDGLELWGVAGHLFLALGSATRASSQAAIGEFEAIVASYRDTQMGLQLPRCLTLLASAYGRLGKTRRGTAVLDQAKAVIEDGGECIDEPELYRVWGELDALEGEPEKARSNLSRAIAAAREQDSRSYELRAATTLARLWQEEGRTTEARELLAPCYGSFTEGFDTADLEGAKALLDELS
jgi:tetratricopeptide (TPR) repeat protein